MNRSIVHWLTPREIESRLESLHSRHKVREAVFLLIGVVLGFFVAGVLPVSNWVLEILRKLYA